MGPVKMAGPTYVFTHMGLLHVAARCASDLTCQLMTRHMTWRNAELVLLSLIGARYPLPYQGTGVKQSMISPRERHVAR